MGRVRSALGALTGRPRLRVLAWTGAGVGAVVVVFAAVVGAGLVWWSGASLAPDPTGLARVDLEPFAGSLVSARLSRPDGTPIPARVEGGRLVPRAALAPGDRVAVDLVVRRPGWLSWLAGGTTSEHLTARTPVARVSGRWLVLAPGAPLRVRFGAGVDRVAYGVSGLDHRTTLRGGRVLSLGPQPPAGSIQVAVAARPWERLGHPVRVTWFPSSARRAVLVSPTVDAPLDPLATVTLTFAAPVAKVLGGERPRFSPSLPGRWTRVDRHTLAFRPTGEGFPLASKVRLVLPRPVTPVDGASATGTAPAVRALGWTVTRGSTLRLNQLLAQAGYLPVRWSPNADPVGESLESQVRASQRPPEGAFSWRFPNTPAPLKALWNPRDYGEITRGAVMMFEDEHGLASDGLAGATVWHALIRDAIDGKRHAGGYTYVYVHTQLPQLLTLWHNGKVVLTSPGNTGVPAAPTQPGTYSVFEHIPVGTMSGRNPDGTHYHDTGIRWISYFHGGDALHAFNRASFGTPQSLGCVELPLAAAARVWPYTPIGTLVTIRS